MVVLERFTQTLRSHKFPKVAAAGGGQITISGGLATFPWDGTTRDRLLKRADEAMLAAKRAGKNRIFVIGDADSATQ